MKSFAVSTLPGVGETVCLSKVGLSTVHLVIAGSLVGTAVLQKRYSFIVGSCVYVATLSTVAVSPGTVFR